MSKIISDRQSQYSVLYEQESSTLNDDMFRVLDMSTLAERIQEIISAGFAQTELARAAGVTKGTSNQWLSGRIKSIKLEYAQGIEALTGFTANWIVTGKGQKRPSHPTVLSTGEEPAEYEAHPRRRAADFELVPDTETDAEVGKIEYWEAKGSCGGGFLNYEQLPKGHLVKEMSFFRKYGLKPANAFAIYADGESMADFIVDGDIVIFDRMKTTPISGKIFLIDHPEGLRIKLLRRGIDGSWILESRNPDKRKYPDERIPPDQASLLKICGQFIYRQGG